mgnify:CR=1 FL=1
MFRLILHNGVLDERQMEVPCEFDSITSSCYLEKYCVLLQSSNSIIFPKIWNLVGELRKLNYVEVIPNADAHMDGSKRRFL